MMTLYQKLHLPTRPLDNMTNPLYVIIIYSLISLSCTPTLTVFIHIVLGFQPFLLLSFLCPPLVKATEQVPDGLSFLL